MIYETLCAALGVMPTWQRHDLVLPGQCEIQMDVDSGDELTLLSNLCAQAYDLSGDIKRFMALLDLPVAERAMAFDRLRKTYAIRREFQTVSLLVSHAETHLLEQIRGLGFRPRQA